MRTVLRGILLLTLLFTFAAWGAEPTTSNEDNAILHLVLKKSFPDGGYTVVSPETSFSGIEPELTEASIKSRKQFIYESLRVGGEGVHRMVEQLFERNKRPVRLSIKSSEKDGYVVDEKRKYDKYFQRGGGGWERWRKERPKAHGMTRVSIPIRNEKDGLVLVYVGVQSGWLAGAGNVILYRYVNQALKELSRVMLWVS